MHLRQCFHYLKNRELDEVYAAVFFRTLAHSLINVFIPVYLLTLGYGLLDVFAFYAVLYLTATLANPPAFYLCSKGAKRLMALGLGLFILYYTLLHQVDAGLHYLVPAVMGGLASAAYFSGLHVEMAGVLDRAREGRELSILRSLSVLAVSLGPLIGALTIIGSSFGTTLFVVAALTLVSAVILLFDGADRTCSFSFMRALRSGSRWEGVAYAAEGVDLLAGTVLWPLFIYLVLADVLSLGAILSASSVLVFVALGFFGRWADRDEARALKGGVLLRAPVWISKIIFISPMGILVNHFLNDVTAHATGVPFHKILYERASREDPSHRFFFRELCLNAGRFFLLGVAAVTASIVWTFVIAFATTFFLLLPLRGR